MYEIPVALITGANQGIGLQVAKKLAAHGFAVLIGSRSLQRGEEAASGVEGDCRAIQLDVTDQASIDAAAERIRDELGRLDVLVNNAGIAHAGDADRSLEEIVRTGRACVASLDEVRAVFETNVFGVIAVTQAMLPLLREAPAGRIVNVSSGRASLAFALDLESTNIKVNAAAPGFTVTAMNNFEGRRTAEEAAREPVRLALLGPDGPTGTFSDENGPLPW